MSHYCVAIITKEYPKANLIEDILAPYDENLSVPYYIEQTKEQFLEKKRRELEEYRTQGPYAKYIQNPEEYAKNVSNPGHLEYVKNFMSEYNKTDEELLDERRQDIPTCKSDDGCSYIDEADNIWSTYNPKSKWDWWVIGGRWDGSLPLKDGTYENIAKVGDVDFGIDFDIEAAMKDEAIVKTYNKLITDGDYLYKAEYFKAIYPTLEQYVRTQKRFSTFAIIDSEGNWHEKGRMGWFGMSSETPEEAISWENGYYDNYIKDIPEDYYIVIVDCHI